MHRAVIKLLACEMSKQSVDLRNLILEWWYLQIFLTLIISNYHYKIPTAIYQLNIYITNIAKLIMETLYSTFTANIIHLSYLCHGKLWINNSYYKKKEIFLIRFLGDNHTILQLLDIKITKSGVSQLNIIRLINSSDMDTKINDVSIHNCS